MADDTVDISYEDMLNSIILGARRSDDRWLPWYNETSGSFKHRVEKVFKDHGVVPSRAQYDRARTAIAVVEGLRDEESGTKKGSKKDEDE